MGKRKYLDSTEEPSKKVKKEITIYIDNKVTEQPQNDNDSNLRDDNYRNAHSFDVKHLRKELARKQGQTMVLTQFLQVCLNPDCDADYLADYLKCGGNSHEILRQIDQENKKNLTLATPAFHLFHLIIVKVQSSLPHMIAITEEACRYFLNTFMSTVEIMISESSGPRHRKVVLKLLTSMVTLNSDLGIEVLSQAPLTPKHLQHIVEKTNYKEKDNVRTCFVQFMTSFLLEGHLPLIKALLEKPGLLGLIIPGLVNDEAEAVLMFLNILKKNVVDNVLLSKSSKLKTFSQIMLHNLFKIYSWKGPPEVNYSNRNESRQEIVSLLSEILLTLFTNHKIGLHFIDNSLGMTDANKNPVLFKAILSLKRPWESEAESELILQIIHRCPDLHRSIVSVIEQSFEPKQSPIWERTVEFTVKLLDRLQPEAMILKMTHLPSPQVANFVRFVTLPVPLLKYIQTNIGKDQTISLFCIKVLVKMLQMLRRYMQILESSELQASLIDLKNRLEYFLPKHMPAPMAVAALVDRVITSKHVPETSSEYILPKISNTDALISLIDLLLLYNDVHPTLFESLEGTVDMKKILDYSMTLSDERAALLKFKVVSLWLILDNSAISLKNPMFKELFLIMLDVYMSDDDTCGEAKHTLRRFLQNTAIFESDEDEIHLFLYTLRKSNVNPPSLVGDIVQSVLENFEELTEFVRNQFVNSDIAKEDGAAALEKLFDDLSENRCSATNMFLENKMPSPFFVGCTNYLHNNKAFKKNLKPFLSLYVVNLLHNNYSPELTEILIGDCKLDARSYVAGWTSSAVTLPHDIIGKDEVLINISKSIAENENLSPPNIFPFLKESSEDSDMTLDEVSFKLDLAQPVDSSELLVWAKYLIYCTVRLTDMGQFSPEQQKKVGDYFQCIIAIAKKHHQIDDCRKILLNLLKNPHMLKLYEPLDSKCGSRFLATQFLLQTIDRHKDITNYLDGKHSVLRPYQQKNYSEIVKVLGNITSLKNTSCEHAMRVLETVGLTTEDDDRVFALLFNAELASCVRDDKEPSLVLELLKNLIDKYSQAVASELQPQILRKAMILYTNLLTHKDININLTKLEVSLAHYFEMKPHQVNKVSENLFRKFFEANAPKKSTSHLAYVLLNNNMRLCNTFKEQMAKPDVISQRELALPLGSAILGHKAFLLENRPLLENFYSEYKSNINKMLEKPHKAGQVYLTNSTFIRKLILECMDVEECAKFFSKTHKFETVESSHVNLTQIIFLKLCTTNNVKKEHLINYFLAMLHLISIALKENKNSSIIKEIVTNIYTVIQTSKTVQAFNDIQTEEFKRVTESALWQNFCKSVLKDSLKTKRDDREFTLGPQLLCLLTQLVKLFYTHEHEDISSLFDMVTSHSEFLNVMLSHSSTETKTRLVEFLHTAIAMNKSVMKSQQIPVYLSSYRASRSPSDRLILAILYRYETSGLPVNEYKPYVWGDSGANHYAVRKNRAASLWAHPTPNQVLNLFERDIIERTVRNFPVKQRLQYDYEPPCNLGVDTASVRSVLDGASADGAFKAGPVKDCEGAVVRRVVRGRYADALEGLKAGDVGSESHSGGDEGVYDPAFVLPLLSHVVAPGSAASCFRVVRGGALALPVAALASHCARMRAAAAHVLQRFYMLLDTETRHKNDKLFLGDFMDTLRQSLRVISASDATCPRVPAACALYLARALLVSTAPFHPLYKPVNNFLIAKNYVDLTLVPDFLSLFHDADVEAHDRRTWILDIVQHGTSSAADLDIVFKTMCIKMIMDCYSTILTDRRTKEKILKVVGALVSIPRAFEILTEGYGLMSWLHAVGRRVQKQEKTLAREVLNIIRNITYSMKLNSLSKSFSNKIKVKQADFPELKMNKDVENEIMVILFDTYRSLECLVSDEVCEYLRVYNSLSKRTIKNMSKNQVLSIVNMVGAVSKCDSVLLLNRAVVTNDCAMMNSKLIDVAKHEPLLHELIMFVQAYIV